MSKLSSTREETVEEYLREAAQPSPLGSCQLARLPIPEDANVLWQERHNTCPS